MLEYDKIACILAVLILLTVGTLSVISYFRQYSNASNDSKDLDNVQTAKNYLLYTAVAVVIGILFFGLAIFVKRRKSNKQKGRIFKPAPVHRYDNNDSPIVISYD